MVDLGIIMSIWISIQYSLYSCIE